MKKGYPSNKKPSKTKIDDDDDDGGDDNDDESYTHMLPPVFVYYSMLLAYN